MLPQNPEAIVLFDGVCNLCSRSVRFIAAHDSKKQIRFASLQSSAGQKALTDRQLPPSAGTSVLFVEDGKLYDHSTAALRIAHRLRFPWNLGAFFLAVPRPVRDAVYNVIARNRYRFFGKKDVCMLPAPGLQDRFLPGGMA